MKHYIDTLTRPERRLRTPHSALRTPPGFTLIELLVVISIIGILAALLLPVLSRVKVKAQMQKAQLEAGQIANAIISYDSEHSKFPVSTNAMNEASAKGQDYTYGTTGLANSSAPTKPGGSRMDIYSLDGAGVNLAYQANNSEVMAVLLDVEYWPAAPGVPTINSLHVKNPQHNKYLNAKMAGDTSSPGVGTDGVYRDPWGVAYIITMDLNYDDKARDSFYRSSNVSADLSDSNTPKRGLNGLIPKQVGGSLFYEANSPVIVWSAGPDKTIDPNTAGAPDEVATKGANKDNIVSWKQ